MSSKTKPSKLVFPQTSLHNAWHRNVGQRFPLTQSVFDLHERQASCDPEGLDDTACRRNIIVLPGYGSSEYRWPTVEQAVKRTIRYFNNLQRRQEAIQRAMRSGVRRRSQLRSTPVSLDEIIFQDQMVGKEINWHGISRVSLRDIIQKHGVASKGWSKRWGLEPLSFAKSAVPAGAKTLIPQLGGVETPTTGATLFSAAGGLADIMHNGRFKAVIAERLDPLKGALNWASTHMPEKHFPTIKSLQKHASKLEELYAESLPRLIMYLAAQYPEEPEEKLLYVALNGLDRQLIEILYTLSIWGDAYAQRRDGMYEELELLVFMVEQAYNLFRTGDITGACDEECQKRIGRSKYHTGDVLTARYSSNGPATIPGAKGPVGAHALEVPHDEASILIIMGVLYFHELRHDIFSDIPGMAEELTQLAVDAVYKAHKDGLVKFSSEFIQIGKQKVKTVSLIANIIGQTFSETDADMTAVLLCGPAFAYSMLATFCAFNAKGNGVFRTNRLLRSYSHYAIMDVEDPDGGGKSAAQVMFEPHMPDVARAKVVAEMLNLMKFHRESAECSALTMQAAGTPAPTVITWYNADSKSKFQAKIEVPVDDILAVIPFVLHDTVNTPLKSLGGLSTKQHVNFDEHRQEKVDALTGVLMDNESEIPATIGDIHGTTVASAAITAYWGLCKSGSNPIVAARKVEPNSRKMLSSIKKAEEVKAAAAQAEAAAAAAQKAAEAQSSQPADKK